MKVSWPTKNWPDYNGMWSSDPPDRIDPKYAALLKNGYVDKSGRVRKQKGIQIVSTASSLRMTAATPYTKVHSLHLYEGRRGENPSSRMIALRGSACLRSKADDLMSAWDTILFPSTITAPTLNKPAAGVFRQDYFYHQNGADPPFRVQCEADSGAAPSTTAEVLGLIAPTYPCGNVTGTGTTARFPNGSYTAYAVTFVYGNRGESGPSMVAQVLTAGETSITLASLPLGGSGVTARKIYRTKIGEGKVFPDTQPASNRSIDQGHYGHEFFRVTTINDNTTTSFTDDVEDNGLDINERLPLETQMPPVAKYQTSHLDRIFWANIVEHPWVAYISSQPDMFHTITSSVITISNTGSGTITVTTVHSAGTETLTVSNYKTKTLMQISAALGVGVVTYSSATADNTPTGTHVIFRIMPGVDVNRTYTFTEVTSQNIKYSANTYTLNAIADTTTQGVQYFPNRVVFSDVTYPERVTGLNSFDVTTQGSKKITAMLARLDGSLVLSTDEDWYIVSGDFVPDPIQGIPNVRVDRSNAGHGSICPRPDGVCATKEGIFFVASDGLRLFRGEASEPAGRPVQDWFARVLREPVARKQLSMVYFEGKLYIALPTDEVR